MQLCLQKNMHALRYTSSLAILLILYLVFVIAFKAPWNNHCSISEESFYTCKENQCVIKSVLAEAQYTNLTSCMVGCEKNYEYVTGEEEPQKFVGSFSALLSIPLYSFAYTCQVQFPPLLHELDTPTAGRVKFFVFTGVLFSMMLYALSAFAG